MMKAVYGMNVQDTGPMVLTAVETTGSRGVLISFFAAAGPIVVRNSSGFELSTNGSDYVAANITAYNDYSVTLSVPKGLAAVVSLRYILHDTPCLNMRCAVYSRETGLPSPPLVVNLYGHAGADPIVWNMPATA